MADANLSADKKAELTEKGWEFVEKSRARNKGAREREIARIVNAVVRQVRLQK